MPVINVPPDGQIYGLGQIGGQLHIYNTGNPPGGNTTYNLTILNVGAFMGQLLAPGFMQTFLPAGNITYIQNMGPSKLQALF